MKDKKFEKRRRKAIRETRSTARFVEGQNINVQAMYWKEVATGNLHWAMFWKTKYMAEMMKRIENENE